MSGTASYSDQLSLELLLDEEELVSVQSTTGNPFHHGDENFGPWYFLIGTQLEVCPDSVEMSIIPDFHPYEASTTSLTTILV
jgi:hypothetical protein